MKSDSYANAKELLKNAKIILLVDWPSTDVPLALLNAGFIVYSYSPDVYTVAHLDEKGEVVFNDIDGPPGTVDIVNVFRPQDEHLAIMMEHVLPLKAKTFWLHPPFTSIKTIKLAAEHDLKFIKGIDITAVATSG